MTARRGPVTAAAWAVVVALAVALPARSVRADRLVVADLYGEPDLYDEAMAVTLLVRSMLVGKQVPRRDLVAALPRAGLGRPAALVALAEVPRVLRAVGGDRILLGTVARAGGRLVATVRVLDGQGRTLGLIAARAGDGDVTGLARAIARKAGPLVGADLINYPVASTGQLRPFARAVRALHHGDGAEAAVSLRGAEAKVAGRVPAARELADAVWANERLPLAARAAAAFAGAQPRQAQKLAEAVLAERPADVLAAAVAARAALVAGDAAAATALLGPARKGVEPAARLARAMLAQQASDLVTRDAELAVLLRGDDPSTLAWVAALAPGALGAREADVLAAASTSSATAPRLSAVLGLRAARTGSIEEGLALISVVELDDEELALLEPIVAAAADHLPAALRLRGELRLRRGDGEGALADLRAAVAARPDDAAALRGLGRVLGLGGQWSDAAAAFAKAVAIDGGGAREQARALAKAGDAAGARTILAALADDDSAESLAARAALLAADGKGSAAVAAAERAAMLSPASPAVQRVLADAYDATGQPGPAADARAVAVEIERGVAAAPAEGGGAEEAAPDRGEGAGGGALVDLLPPLLDGFPALAEHRAQRVALLPLAGGGARPWSLRRGRPERLRAALEETLTGHYGVELVGDEEGEPVTGLLSHGRLAELAGEAGADAVLLYRVRADGSRAHVELRFYDVTRDELGEAAERVDGRRLGLVAWNQSLLAAIVLVVVLLAAWLVLAAVRGWGGLEVRIKRDTATEEDTFLILLSRHAEAPPVEDAAELATQLRLRGHRVGRRDARLPGPVTNFRWVPCGIWHVHLVGVFHKGGELRRLPAGLVQRAQVRRGRATVVEHDLVPKTTEFRIRVVEGAADVEGAKVWVGGARDKAVGTNSEGIAALELSRGHHVLHVQSGELHVEKALHASDTKIHNLHINLTRERRMADASDGVSLALPQERRVAAPAREARPGLSGPARPSRELVVLPAAPAVTAPGPSIEELVAASAPGPRKRPISREEPPGRAQTSDSTRTFLASAGAPASAAASTSPPSGLRRYRPIEELGRGAMGVVYRARDVVLSRDVALKIVGSELRRHPSVRSMFLSEAQALAQLNHPNVVTVYDQGQDGDEAFVVMELVDGTTLEDMLDGVTPVPLDRTLDVVDQLCAGLSYAHAHRVVHRDVKPANIYISKNGVVKLGDFGLARVLGELKIRQTEVRGTPLYMAPEQIHGSDIDFRADLYAVGCTFFELATGRPPFMDGDILYHHVHTRPPAPSSFAPTLPREVDKVVLACLDKDKAKRSRRPTPSARTAPAQAAVG